MSNKNSFKLGTTYIIGSYILPGELHDELNNTIDEKIILSISNCRDVIDKIKTKELDLGLIETPTFDNDIIAKEWLDNELVLCSNIELPPLLTSEELSACKIISHKHDSPITKLIHNFFNSFKIPEDIFYSSSKINNTTAAIQGVKWSKPSTEHPTVTIVSLRAIEDEVKSKNLFLSRIKNHKMQHKFYIVYHKDVELKSIQKILSKLIEYNR